MLVKFHMLRDHCLIKKKKERMKENFVDGKKVTKIKKP